MERAIRKYVSLWLSNIQWIFTSNWMLNNYIDLDSLDMAMKHVQDEFIKYFQKCF